MLELMRDSINWSAKRVQIGTAPVTFDSIEYRASNTGLQSRWPPVVVQVNVRIKNLGPHPRRLEILGGNCAVRLLVYSSDDIAHGAKSAAGAHPLFDATNPTYQCYVRSVRLELASGEDTTVQSAGGGPGLRLPAGRYDLVGVVTIIPPEDSLRRHGPQLVAVPAGSIRVLPPFD